MSLSILPSSIQSDPHTGSLAHTQPAQAPSGQPAHIPYGTPEYFARACHGFDPTHLGGLCQFPKAGKLQSAMMLMIPLLNPSEFLLMSALTLLLMSALTQAGHLQQNSLQADFNMLGVEQGASWDDVREAYRQRCKETYPNENRDCDTTKEFLDVNRAYFNIRDEYQKQGKKS